MRSEFDLDPGLIYLNAGTHSITPRGVLEAVARELREYERNPTRGIFEAFPRLWQVQKRVAAFFGARPQDLFFRNNVTEAMNAAVLGFPLDPGGEILLSDLEYGAVANLCRFRAERDGLTLRTFGLGGPGDSGARAEASPAALAAQVVAALGPKTRMLVLSHVMTATGLVLPVAEIARETRRRGVLLAVDGAHAPGALPLDFRGLDDVDFYGTNLHKWMLGPKGTGFGWVPERHHGRLRPLAAGWTTFGLVPPFEGFGDGSAFAGRMVMTGCQDFARFLALDAMLALWERLGPEAIRSRLRALQAEVERKVEGGLGWERVSPPAGPLLGPLVSYALPGKVTGTAELGRPGGGFAFMARLAREQGLQISITSARGRPLMRLSPHVHNSEEEIGRAVAILSR